MEIQFAHIEYSIQTKSIDIFTIGCDGKCEGCCNPELKDWNRSGYNIEQVIKKVDNLTRKFTLLIDRIFIVGGDPVDAYNKYSESMCYLIRQLKNLDKPIYLFTRYELEDIPNELLNMVDFVKTGAYIPSKKCENNVQYGIKLATVNQKIYQIKGK